MVDPQNAAELAHTIQMATAPVFLLTGIGAFLNVMVGRLARVVDRARVLEARFTPSDHADHGRQVWELRLLDRRMRVVSIAISLCTASAALICGVVAGLFLARLNEVSFSRAMAIIFSVAMVMLIGGLTMFLVEVHLSMKSIKIRHELLERQEKRWIWRR
jgi:sterol desaturase/sphingolipid hydroxylase (fatty acid hydroxylase superfamily)